MSHEQTPSTERRRWLMAAGVAMAAVLPYANSLGNGFAFDDFPVIREHPMVNGTASPWGLLTWVYEPGAYRPLTMLTYAANERLGGALGHHLVNLALHVLVTLGVFRLALALLDSTAAAAVAGVLFAVHPVHTEAVSSIVGRAELLAAALAIGALLAFVRAERTGGTRRVAWLAVSLAAFAAAPFAKESACAAVPLFAATARWLDRRWRWRRLIGWTALYAAAAIPYLTARLAVIGTLLSGQLPAPIDNPLAHVDAAVRVRTAIIILWDYAVLLVTPLRLSADYSFNELPLALRVADPRFVWAVIALACLTLAVAAAARRVPVLAMAALFTIVPLALTANVLFPIGTIKAERLLYLPSLGWCLGLAGLAALFLRSHPRLTIALLAVVVAAQAGRTWARNLDWRDNLSLFTATLATAPGSARTHHNAGAVFQHAGRIEEAARHYERALEIYPAYASAAYALGHLHHLAGREGRAMRWYLRALAIDPRFAKAHLQIGLIRQARGEYDAAEAAFRTGLETAPEDPLLVVSLSAVLVAQGDSWRARNLLRYFDGLPPGDPAQMELARNTAHYVEVAIQ